MTLAQLYNKTIQMKPINSLKKDYEKNFDLCFYTYQGKITTIIDKFNHQSIKTSEKIVENSFSSDKKRNALQISAFLNFPNIFLYLLTFKADPGYLDENGQSTWHIIGYRGHTKIMGILLNHIRYQLKLKSLTQIDEIKKQYGFSNLDIVKGKLSRAVYLTEVNLKKFQELQKTLKKESDRLINEFISELTKYLTEQDKNGQTPLHLAAMSKFSLSHEVVNQILEFDFFKLDDSWEDYLNIFSELQSLEIKTERMNQDPRRSQRLERELNSLLGEDIIKNLSKKFKEKKYEMLSKVINIQDKNGDCLLHISSFFGNFRIINRLVYYGGNKKKENNEDKIPVDIAKDNKVRKVLTNLNEAAKNSDEKNIQELVNYGKDINEKLSIFSLAPIHKIIESKEKNKHEVLKKMLDMGSDPNIKDSNGWTALHYACQNGDFDSIKILLNNDADINTYSNNQRTPLHLAAKNNYPEIVKYLLEKKANPNYKDELGCTPSHLAAKEGNYKCIDYLLFYGADLLAVDFRGWNILHYASFHGHKDTIRFICKYDADYDNLQNTKNSQNKLPVQILTNYSLKKYFITIWHAAREGDLDMTKRLINEGENINQQSYFEKNTPLHLAVLNNHYLEVRLLLENKGNKDIENKHHIKPLEYAKLMLDPIRNKFNACKDLDRETFDLREVIRPLINKKEEILNATICEKNRNVRVWVAKDFVVKINKALGNNVLS